MPFIYALTNLLLKLIDFFLPSLIAQILELIILCFASNIFSLLFNLSWSLPRDTIAPSVKSYGTLSVCGSKFSWPETAVSCVYILFTYCKVSHLRAVKALIFVFWHSTVSYTQSLLEEYLLLYSNRSLNSSLRKYCFSKQNVIFNGKPQIICFV